MTILPASTASTEQCVVCAPRRDAGLAARRADREAAIQSIDRLAGPRGLARVRVSLAQDIHGKSLSNVMLAIELSEDGEIAGVNRGVA